MSYNIKPRYNKDGELISYCIRVDRGRDAEGVRMKPYTTTWRVPEGYTSAKKIQMELNSVAGQFEADCKAGKILTKEERKAKARADAERAEQERLEKERRVTFKAYASDVFMARKATTFSRNAYTNYEDALNRLNKYLGDYPLEEIKSADINRCLVALQTREYCRQSKGREKGKTKVEDSGKLISFSTVIKCYTVLSGVFKMAYMDDVIAVNPMFKVERPKQNKDDKAKHTEVEALTVEEAQRLIICMDKEPLQWKIFVRLLLDTGIRRGEACGLTWDCVHFDTNEIDIKHNLQYTPEDGVYDVAPKSGKYRTVTVDSEIMKMLHELRSTQKELQKSKVISLNNSVFKQSDGEALHPQTPTGYFQSISKRYGFKNLHPHMLRHTYASIAITSGADIASVSENLGHADKAITLNLYTHADEEAKRRASQIAREALKIRKEA